ncbi:efflux RND transporter permease subunit [bacterium]|nr:efflux RND transporter permease subunit [bacterium]
MTWIVTTSLKHRMAVIILSIAAVIWGLRSLQSAPLDVFPEFAPPTVEVQTEAPGLTSLEVESLVSTPIENTLNGTPFLDLIRSKSVMGLSSVQLLFKPGTDLIRARQLVQERLAVEAARLPTVAKPPIIIPPRSSTSRVLKIGMSSQKLSQIELTELARWTIRPRLMSIPGVGNVAIWGQRDKQYQILVDPDRLRAHGVTLANVEGSAADAVALSSGGFVDTPNQRLAVQQRSEATGVNEIGQTVVGFQGGASVRLADVAEVVEGFPPPIGDAVINGGPGLLLIVEKQPWGNTLDVTRRVEQMINDLRPGLKDIEIDPTIFRPATFIERSLDNLTHALVIGCVLVVLVLISFLFDWRTSVISLTAIPLSLIAAAVVLRFWGETFNVMVIAGLIIALGEVVDDAIIDVENILRRLKLNSQLPNPLDPFHVVLEASHEVRSAVVFATLIVTLVFLPILFLDGLAGSFFRPLGIAYILAILSSLVVALTVTPAMSLLLLPSAARKRNEAPLTIFLLAIYRRILPHVIGCPKIAIVCLVLLFIVSGAMYRTLGEEFLPNFRETDFLMHWIEKPGTSLEAMQRVTVEVSKDLQAVPGVRNFGAHIGRAEVADEVVGPNFAELWISVDAKADLDQTMHKVQEVVDSYPGLFRDVLTYLKEVIKEVLTGAKATIVVRVFGPDLGKLRSKADEIYESIKQIPGVASPKVEQQQLLPQIQIRLSSEALSQFGLTPGQVRRSVETLVSGRTVGEVYRDQKSFAVVVWGTPRVRMNPSAIAELPIDLPTSMATTSASANRSTSMNRPALAIPLTTSVNTTNSSIMPGYVPLGDLADIQIVAAPNTIQHEGSSRRIDVTCNVQGRDLGSVARDIEKRVREISFEHGYHPEFLGEYTARQASQRRLLLLASMAVIGILILLQIDFQSWRLALLVFLTIPFALVGGVWAAWLSGGVLSLGSLVGFVTVLGIAARNGIMLVSHYRHLETVEGEQFGIELVQRGSEERLSPILMTALATGLALVPLVMGGNKPGYEIEFPMAVVILGGLVTSTVLNLFLLPPIYVAYGREKGNENH